MLTGATLLRESRVILVAVVAWELTTSGTFKSLKRVTIVSGPPGNAGLPVRGMLDPLKTTKVPGRVTNQSVPARTPSVSGVARVTVPDAKTTKSRIALIDVFIARGLLSWDLGFHREFPASTLSLRGTICLPPAGVKLGSPWQWLIGRYLLKDRLGRVL